MSLSRSLFLSPQWRSDPGVGTIFIYLLSSSMTAVHVKNKANCVSASYKLFTKPCYSYVQAPCNGYIIVPQRVLIRSFAYRNEWLGAFPCSDMYSKG